MRRSVMSARLRVVYVLVLMGCSEIISVAEVDGVRVESGDGELTIENDRTAAIAYLAIAEDDPVDWAPCTVESWCPRVPPKSVSVHPLSQSAARAEGLHFFWWEVIDGPAGPVAGEVRLLVLEHRPATP